MKLTVRPIEIFLFEICLYLLLWIINETAALLMSAIFAGISLVILLVSIIVEMVEPSKVPKSYFIFMIINIIVPLLTGIGYYLVGHWF